MQVIDDRHTKERYRRSINFTINIGLITAFILYAFLFTIGIYEIITKEIKLSFSIPITVLSSIWFCQIILFLYIEREKDYLIRDSKKNKWSNQFKWNIVFCISLNILIIFLVYSTIQRKIRGSLK